MASPMTEESKALLKLLDDGQWHLMEDIISRLALMVAPGKALRRYELKASHWHQVRPRKGPALTDEQKIASGQRTLANVTVHSMKKRYIELDVMEQGRVIRRRPEAVPYAHKDAGRRTSQFEDVAHASRKGLVIPIDPTDDARVARIVREQVDAALAAYQVDMQQWLVEQFAVVCLAGGPSCSD